MDGPAFLVATTIDDGLPVELREVFPTMSSVLQLKLGMWADNLVAKLIADFDTQSRRILRAPE